MNNRNHIFTCATCRRQWTIHSRDPLDCFFVGLCHSCIGKLGLTFDELLKKLKNLATEERFAQELAEMRGL